MRYWNQVADSPTQLPGNAKKDLFDPLSGTAFPSISVRANLKTL
jgi:hypothetical protein